MKHDYFPEAYPVNVGEKLWSTWVSKWTEINAYYYIVSIRTTSRYSE